ncbi:SagB family peptide dehydrogenase [Saccharopolyspora cebuensis]|uniref:SagB family peptide dehydrogenase n=1 Tax=Saccharopolyspora cebuensis TaxID=418759 RepID=A0ABV4CFK9_9PSEU
MNPGRGRTGAGTAAREYVELVESSPLPGDVEWDDAPGQFKLYRGRPRIPLDETPGQVGELLLDSYGVTRYRWTAADALRRLIGTRGAEPGGGAELARNSLRPVPSGGSRFPGEVYVVSGPGGALPTGVHHYDAAHHALVALREGDWTGELAAGLGAPAARLPLTLLVTAFFWKNAFKYGELTYRLCALDLGVLVGQVLAVAPRLGPARVRYRFVDDDLDGLLRLDPMRESVYAAITIDEAPGRGPGPLRPLRDGTAEASRTGTASKSEREWTLDAQPLQARVHRAARLPDATEVRSAPAVPDHGTAPGPTVALPERAVDLLAGLHERRSSMGYFAPAELPAEPVSALLAAAAEGYRNDLADESGASLRHTALYCAVNRVSGVAPGVYRYRPGWSGGPGLERVRTGDIGAELQDSLLIKLFNMDHTGLCVYPVGHYGAGFDVHGDRWFRIQNMEAGIAVQRLYLAAASLGLRCHASLGYDVQRTHRLLGLDGTGLSSLIQVMIGSGRAPGDFYEASWR